MFNVAVITPVFNTQDYLHRCIQSILNQKGVSLQHFIIDDGSTDNSAAIARFYQHKDSRVTFINKTNEGQGVARNIGIKLAESEYIYFVDSDDYLGEDTLSILYNTAKKNNLDICSPNVPKHYFDKPLEYISCLPCKSQFIKLKIIRDYSIFQPDIRSGQDGVFSHLVLTHCNRIGMTELATFHYTHAREGSTFTSHLKRHDLVPDLIDQHFSAIEHHYDKFNLWDKNALRLLCFISDESLRNRLDPHLSYLDDAQKRHCFSRLSRVAKKAYSYISEQDKKCINPALTALATKDEILLAIEYATKYSDKKYDLSFSKNCNLVKDKLLICKYANNHLSPSLKEIKEQSIPASKLTSIPQGDLPEDINDINSLKSELRTLREKLDLAINSINNSTIQIISQTHSQACNLLHGDPDIVVSLTTLPHRLPLAHLAIESIFTQTTLPGRVILWITDQIKLSDALTPQLKTLAARGLEIREVEDIGPHTKLIYALKEFPEKSIITVDDDIIYPTNTISCLMEQHTKFPSAIICNWARELAFDSTGKVKGVRSGKLLTPPRLESDIEQALRFDGTPNILAFPYGTLAILYPPKSLNAKVFDVKTFRRLCPKEDDIWFKAMSLLNHTPVVATNLGISPPHHCVFGSQSNALRHDNHGLNRNEEQMRAVFDELNLYKIIKKYVK